MQKMVLGTLVLLAQPDAQGAEASAQSLVAPSFVAQNFVAQGTPPQGAAAQAPQVVRVRFLPHGAELMTPAFLKPTCQGNKLTLPLNSGRLVTPAAGELRLWLGTGRLSAAAPTQPPQLLHENELRLSCVGGEVALSHGAAVRLLVGGDRP